MTNVIINPNYSLHTVTNRLNVAHGKIEVLFTNEQRVHSAYMFTDKKHRSNGSFVPPTI